MSNITTVPQAHAGAVLAFTAKNSKGETVTKVAHTHTDAVSAPKAVRLQAAQVADLQALVNGQYKPFMASVRAALSKKQQDTLAMRPDFTLNPTNKAGVVSSLRAIGDVWAQDAAARMAEGKKPVSKVVALSVVLGAFIAHVDAQDAARTVNAEQAAAQGAVQALQQDAGAAPAPADNAAPAPAPVDAVDAAAAAGVVLQ